MIHDKLFPWRVAAVRKLMVTHMTLGLLWSEAYWSMLGEMLYPEPR